MVIPPGGPRVLVPGVVLYVAQRGAGVERERDRRVIDETVQAGRIPADRGQHAAAMLMLVREYIQDKAVSGPGDNPLYHPVTGSRRSQRSAREGARQTQCRRSH